MNEQLMYDCPQLLMDIFCTQRMYCKFQKAKQLNLAPSVALCPLDCAHNILYGFCTSSWYCQLPFSAWIEISI